MTNQEYKIGEKVWVYLADADIWGSGEVVGYTAKRIKVNVTCRMVDYIGNFKSTSVKQRNEEDERAL